jgi:hypothetical protein
MITQLWHSFLALPLVVRIVGFLAVVLAAVKAKAIAEFTKAAWNAASNWFWSSVSNHVSSHPPKASTKVDLRMVAGSPLHSNWSISVTPTGKEPMLLLLFTMGFAHAEDMSVIIRRAYLKGTTDSFPIGEIVVEGPYDQPETFCIGVTPVKAKPGKKLTGKVVFVDQFNHKHESDKITFSPNTMPPDLLASKLEKTPNCVFCNQKVELADQAKEAQMTAHTSCIWR